MDYLFFLYGLVLVLLALLVRQVRRQPGAALAWFWLEAYALLFAVHEWLDAFDFFMMGHGPLHPLRLAFLAAAYFGLLEFGRASGRRLSPRALGRWIHLPALAGALAGAGAGWGGLFISLRYAVGLTGGLWAAWALWRGAPREGEGASPRPLRFAAAAMALYALTTPFCNVRSAFPPLAFISAEAFFGVFHLPVQLLRGLLTVAMLIALWRHLAQRGAASAADLPAAFRLSRSARWILAAMALTLVFGWFFTDFIGERERQAQLDNLEARTRIAAITLDPQACARLCGARQDPASPDYRLLQKRLKLVCETHADISRIFLVGLRGGQWVYLLDIGQARADAGPPPPPPPDLGLAGPPPLPPPGRAQAPSRPVLPGDRFQGDGEALLKAFQARRVFVKYPAPPDVNDDGPWIWVLAPVIDSPATAPVAMLGVCIDVHPGLRRLAAHRLTVITIVMLVMLLLVSFHLAQTRSRRAAARLAASERRYRILVEDSPNAVSLLDAQGRMLTLNRVALRALGCAEREMLGQPFESVWPPELRPQVREAVARTLAGQAVRFQSEFSRPHDRGLFLDVSLNPVSEDGATVTHLIAIGVNISAQKKTEKVLRESEEKFRAVTENTLDAIVMMDPEGRISLWNKAAERIFGYAAAEVLGRDMHALLAPSRYEPIYAPAVERYLRTGWGDMMGHNVELEGRRRDGSEFPVEISLSCVTLNGRRHAVGIVRDITERKAFEDEIRRSQAALEATNQDLAAACERAGRLAGEAAQANAAKSAFLANMSHEIRTPMNGVLGMTALLLGTPLTYEQKDYAGMIKASAEHLLALIDDILDFSRIEAHKLTLESIDFDLRAVIEEMNDLLALKAWEKGLEYASLIEPNVPGLLRGDPGRLRQVLTNLVGNAIKFTPRGEVRIRVALAGEAPGAVRLRFEVADTGIGIPAEKVAVLFDPFTQVDSSITRRFGGSGLGLSISKDLVRLMDGQIGVQSEPGAGSTFWFTARLETRPEAEDPRLAAAAALCRRRVLLVGRAGFGRSALRQMLEGWGAPCAEAAAAGEALPALRAAAQAAAPFDAVIVEKILPDGDGERLLKSVQAEPALAGLRMILLHPVSEHRDAPRLRQLGFADCLTKPVKTAQLLDCLRDAPAAADVSAANAALAEPAFRLRRANVRLLLVEDNPINQKVALKTVERLGLGADVVDNGVQALAALRSSRYDLVLMDVQMPEMDGLEATRRIRSGQGGAQDPQVPIVAMTAYAMPKDRESCLAAGMSDYLVKPLEIRELQRALARWLPECAADVLDGLPSPPPAPEPPAPPPAPPVFDRASVLNRLGGDAELMTTLLQTFLEDAPNQFHEIERTLAAADAALLRIVAHNLKGAAAAVGVESLRQALQRLEAAGASGELAHAPGLLQAARGEFFRAEPILKAEANQ